MIELEIDKLLKYKCDFINTPNSITSDSDIIGKEENTNYIKKHHKDFFNKVENLIYALGGKTEMYGHSEQIDFFKNQLYFMLYL